MHFIFFFQNLVCRFGKRHLIRSISILFFPPWHFLVLVDIRLAKFSSCVSPNAANKENLLILNQNTQLIAHHLICENRKDNHTDTMLKFIYFFIIIIILSCKAKEIKINNTNVTKLTTKSDQSNSTIKISYNKDLLPDKLNSVSQQSGYDSYIIDSKFTYDNEKRLIKIVTITNNRSIETKFNWLSNTSIEVSFSEKYTNGDSSEWKGNIILNEQGLILSFNNQFMFPYNLTFEYDSNSNCKKITDKVSKMVRISFLKFDSNLNPFASNYSVWALYSLSNNSVLGYRNLCKNNVIEMEDDYGVYQYDTYFYNESQLPISCNGVVKIKSNNTTNNYIFNYEY